MDKEIRVQFFDGVNELTRVCRITGAKSYTHYFIYDVYDDESCVSIYSGCQRPLALRYMQETFNLLAEDEQIIMG